MSRDAVRRVVLAIEASQRLGAVAAARMGDGTPESLVEVELGPPDPDRDRLMPAIDRAMRGLGARPAELDTIIVSIGPGGFTGLRMATAAAQAIAFATRCRVAAVPSAAVAARSAAEAAPGSSARSEAPAAGERDTHSMIVALAGKGDDAWISEIELGAHGPCRILSAGILDAAGFAAMLARSPSAGATTNVRTGAAGSASAGTDAIAAPPILVCDEFLPASLAEVADRRGLPRRALQPSARACLVEGDLRCRADDPGTRIAAEALLPLYPREPEAVRLWRERAAGSRR